jgi:probable F420-dependent oxidoreductase
MALKSFTPETPPDWNFLFSAARAADEAGIDRLVVSDHVVFGERLDEYGKPELGGAKGGKQPTGPDGAWLDPLTTLSVVAGMTRRVRLGTNILIAALRRPVTLAKTAATLDVLSGGRLDLGVGVGWQREEYEAAGLEFDGRGKLLNHSLEVCQLLWREQRASYDSPLLKFSAIHQMPKPTRPGGVPIWVSGTINKSSMDRLARFGSAWIPWGPDAADLVNSIPRMRDEMAKRGRKDADKLGVVGHIPMVKTADGDMDIPRTMEKLPALVKAGVTDLRATLTLPADQGAATDKLRGMVKAFRSAVGRKD